MPGPSLQIGLQHHQAGRLREAEAIYRQILAANPNDVDALHFLGLIAHQTNHPDAAVRLLERALQIQPDRHDIHNNLGNIYRETGQLERAVASFDRAVSLQSNFYEGLFNRGQALLKLMRGHEALRDLHEATRLQPDSLDARRALAEALLMTEQYAEAIELFREVIGSAPAVAHNHYNLGVALDRSGRRDEAIAEYERAVQLDPNLAQAHFNLGACLVMGMDVRPGLEHFRAADRVTPMPMARDMLLHFQHHLPETDPRDLFEQHLQWARDFEQPLKSSIRPPGNDRDPSRRLRVGYVSRDFRRHSVAHFIEPLLAAHDRREVETFCYADEFRNDSTTARIRDYDLTWRNITAKSDTDVTELVRADRIDILVDLAGHSQENRLLVFARKPAPVQVTYLGYPDTTGMRAMDYRLTDALADPPGMTEALHTEQLLRLPECAWCYRPDDQSPPVEPRLASDAVTFGSFNVASKINPPLIAIWAQILRALPNAQLVLKTGHGLPAVAHPQIRAEFDKLGIAADRVEMVGYVRDMSEHLRLYNRIDIGFDTFPYHGTTTTCEALWMGVPVITLTGRTHVSRVGVSLLSAVGLSDLVAADGDAYISIATALARDVTRRTELRRDLRDRMRQSPLMDAAGFARNVEAAYRTIW